MILEHYRNVLVASFFFFFFYGCLSPLGCGTTFSLFSDSLSPHFLVPLFQFPQKLSKTADGYFPVVSERNVLIAIYKRNDGFPPRGKTFRIGCWGAARKWAFDRFPGSASRRQRLCHFQHSPKAILMHYWPDLSQFSASAALIEKWLSRRADWEMARFIDEIFAPAMCQAASRSGLN